MKIGFQLALFIALFAVSLQSAKDCTEQTACANEKEYNLYIRCMEDVITRNRNKRSTDCEDDCDVVDCGNCAQRCTPTCQECSDCTYLCRKCCTETCSTNTCCTKICHHQCRTHSCRESCKKDCKRRVSELHHSGTHTSNHTAKHNITTIINLHNIVNNTNLIDIPIKINNTNYNNITLRRDGSGVVQVVDTAKLTEKTETTVEQNENCCAVIGPRQCVYVNYFPFTRCFHYRHRKCGSLCTAPVMHMQNQQLCLQGACQKRVTYIPQPRSRCHYHPAWPYVTCGHGGYWPNCEGCYEHYNSPQTYSPQARCFKCYDDGYGIGPYYRQGPFYRPAYSHVAPCWQIGTCGYPFMPPALPYYPSYYGFNPMGYGGMYPAPYLPPTAPFGNYPGQSYDSGYPSATYLHDINIPGSSINPGLTLKSGETNSSDASEILEKPEFTNPRYAKITIDTSKPPGHKEQRVKRKKDADLKVKINNTATKSNLNTNASTTAMEQNTTEKTV